MEIDKDNYQSRKFFSPFLRHNEQQMASIILAYGAGNPF
jgi:hypothetical protein